jgi:acyl homoserine lactone synthase
MLKIIESQFASRFPVEIDAMFQNRAEVFWERLGWRVSVKNGRERDAFDDADPVYLVSLDPITGKYRGSARLLPTTGPNMLRDVFPFLLGKGEYVESSTIWECSRMCVASSEANFPRTSGGLNRTLGELIIGMAEVALKAGVTQIVSVFDDRIYRVLKAAGCNPQLIGRPRKIEGTMCYVGIFDTDNSPLEVIRDVVEIDGAVLAPEHRELAAA